MANPPATAGYSGTPLIKKLGLRPGLKTLLVHQPDHYFKLLGEEPEQFEIVPRDSNEKVDFAHLFATKYEELNNLVPILKSKITKEGILWIFMAQG